MPHRTRKDYDPCMTQRSTPPPQYSLCSDSPPAPKTKSSSPKRRASSKSKCAGPPPIQHATTEELVFRHTHWTARRKKVIAALARSGQSDHRIERFCHCGAGCHVQYSKSAERYRVSAEFCHDRHCEPCGRSKANLIAKNLERRLTEKAEGRYRFVTLTLRHCDEPLEKQLAHLLASFRRLRASKFWRQNQRGGCAVIEVKWRPQSRRWHPHMHVIAEGGYIDQYALSAAWSIASNGSTIVDVRALKSGRDAAWYTAKYLGKGTNVETWEDPDVAREWIIATKGLRICGTYGSWRGYKILQKPDKLDDWIDLGSLDKIIADAKAGAKTSQLWLTKIRHGDYTADYFMLHDYPPPPFEMD